MEGFSAPQSFYERVDHAIRSSDFTGVVKFLVSSPASCKSDPVSIMRLLNNMSRLTLTDSINDCFQALIKAGFTFDSIEYVEPLTQLISKNKTVT